MDIRNNIRNFRNDRRNNERNFKNRSKNGRNFGNKATMEETLEMIEGIMKKTSELRKVMKIKEIQSVNFEKNLMSHL